MSLFHFHTIGQNCFGFFFALTVLSSGCSSDQFDALTSDRSGKLVATGASDSAHGGRADNAAVSPDDQRRETASGGESGEVAEGQASGNGIGSRGAQSADGSEVQPDVIGWKESVCNGNIFHFFRTTPALLLGGWPAGGGAVGGGERQASEGGLVEQVEGCLEFPIDSKPLQYVLIDFNPQTFEVTQAQPYLPEVFPGTSPGDYNHCARALAKVPSAGVSVAELPASDLQTIASCGPASCCLKLR